MEQNSQIDIYKSHEHHQILLPRDAITGEFTMPLATRKLCYRKDDRAMRAI